MRLVITGGLGFIGSNFINYWMRQHTSDSILNIDSITYAADFKNIDTPKAQRYKFIKANINDRGKLRTVAKEYEVIVNFAAETHVDKSISNSRKFVESNILGVQNLLEIARINDMKFHQISTDEVFGSLPLGSNLRFDEHTPYNPLNPYSATKASADMLVRSYVNTYGLNATISNSSNNYGPNQNQEKLIPKTILNAINGKKIPLYGNGCQVRDWIYVLDHCSAIDLVLTRGNRGQSYLISSSNEKKNLEVVKEILFLLRKSENLIEFVRDRPGHDVRYSLKRSRFFDIYGWKPSYSFERGLKETIEYYKLKIANYQKVKRKILNDHLTFA